MKNRMIILLILIIIAIGLWTPTIINRGITGIFSEVINIINKPIVKSSDFFSNLSKINEIVSENIKLKQENNTNKILKIENNNLTNQIKEFEEINKVDTKNFNNLILAKVNRRNLSTFHDYIEINKGEQDGIKIEQLAISKDGVLGVVDKTTPNTSVIKLFTTNFKDNKFLTYNKSLKKDVYYLDSYDIRKNEFILKIVTHKEKDKIKKGDEIISTQYYNSVKNIPVAVVSEVITDPETKEIIIKAVPKTNFSNIDLVMVINND